MITQITSATKDEYTRLFAEATDFLNRDDVAVDSDIWTKNKSKINSLASYYFQLQNILKEENAEKGIEKFLVLPLDEPIFEINANNRTINIPTEFRQNGIGALGDKGAEILYFSINRYFDAMDFGSNDVQIYVQWENADGEKKISGIFNKDTSSDPNHIYFGWEIDDQITKSAGAIKFSIRILVLNPEDQKTIIYNFNTLTATVGINSTLHYDFDYSAVEKSAEVASRIRKRIVKSPGVTSYKLTPPTFIEPEQNIVIDLVKQSDGTYSADLTALAASIEDQTVISEAVQYFWFQVDDENEKTSDLFNATRDDLPVKVVPTKSTKPIQGLTYYTDEACTSSITYDTEWPRKDDGSDDLKYTLLYVKKGSFTIKAAAKYGVQACTIDGEEISEATKCSYYWTVPTAKALKINSTNTSYEQAEKVILNLNNDTQNYEANLMSAVENLNDYHYITYTWKKDGAELDNSPIKMEDNIENIKRNLSFSSDERANGQGKYELYIVGTKNNDNTKESIQYFNVTLPVPEPSSKTKADLNSNVVLITQGQTAEAEVSYGETYQSQPNISDLFITSYEWFKIYNVTTSELNNLRDLAEEGTLTKELQNEYFENGKCVSIKADSSIDKANEFITDNSTPSNIFCIMTAHFNGQTAQTSTPVFNVVAALS